jgi:hypothetical protein
MGSTYGRQSITTVGQSVRVSADGRPREKTGGVTIDWTTVTAVSGSDATYNDGVVVKVGEKALRYGQVVTMITATRLYGPYDPAAVDGRQTLARGQCFIVDRTTREDEIASNHPPVIFGGICFIDRIVQSGVAAASLALGPTLANLLTAFPELHPAGANY